MCVDTHCSSLITPSLASIGRDGVTGESTRSFGFESSQGRQPRHAWLHPSAEQEGAASPHPKHVWLQNAGIPLLGAACDPAGWQTREGKERENSPIKGVLVGVWHVHDVHETSVS